MKRRLMKTLVWRVVAVAITYMVAFVVTGEYVGSLEITMGANATKMVGYYLHEWLWDHFGRKGA